METRGLIKGLLSARRRCRQIGANTHTAIATPRSAVKGVAVGREDG